MQWARKREEAHDDEERRNDLAVDKSNATRRGLAMSR